VPIPPAMKSSKPMRSTWPSSVSLYSESELSSDEYTSECSTGEQEGTMVSAVDKADEEDEGIHHSRDHLMRPTYRGILRWFLDTPIRDHRLPFLGNGVQS
ncbi:hypothetical protein Pmar_PMAR003276, partial [Perkinsus marinus ATCC 50983]